MKLRTLIADDEPLAREGVALALAQERDVEIVGTCGDGHSAVRAIRRNRGLVVVSGQARFVWWFKRLFPRLLDRIQQFRRVRRAPRVPMIAGRIGPAQGEPARRVA